MTEDIEVKIDPGHGGVDPGAVGNGLQEKDIVFTIAKGVYNKLLTVPGIKPSLTRTTDTKIELSDRAKIANKDGADAFVSIHVNAGGGKGGFETFRYTKASKNSERLQDIIHASTFGAVVAKESTTIDRGKKTGNLAVLRETNMPAVLVECLFIDVLSDAEKLKRSDIIQAFIDGITNGIVSYFGLTIPTTIKGGEVEMTADETKQIKELQKIIEKQEERIKALEKQNEMPKWAAELLGDMKNKKLITTSADKGQTFSTISQMMKNAGFLEQRFLDHVASVNEKGGEK